MKTIAAAAVGAKGASAVDAYAAALCTRYYIKSFRFVIINKAIVEKSGTRIRAQTAVKRGSRK